MPSRRAGLCPHIVGPALSLAPLLWQTFTANERALLLALIHPGTWRNCPKRDPSNAQTPIFRQYTEDEMGLKVPFAVS